ncbi:MAG: hypothetical protein IPN10_09910 [Saprospiraceae bacterium]|nr:hypothetical protein [Saprospiraceae bacterium]
MQAESVTAGNLIQLNEKIQTQEGDFLSPGGIERNDGPFELIPGDEKEEISEEESSNKSGNDALQFFPLRTALNVDRCISKNFYATTPGFLHFLYIWFFKTGKFIFKIVIY